MDTNLQMKCFVMTIPLVITGQLYFEIINIFVRSLKERFEQESFEHYANMESVLLIAINGVELFEEGVALLRNEYNDDLDIDMLVTELPVVKTYLMI